MQWGCLLTSPNDIIEMLPHPMTGELARARHTIRSIAHQLSLEVHCICKDVGCAIFLEDENNVATAQKHAEEFEAEVITNPEEAIYRISDQVQLFARKHLTEGIRPDMIALQQSIIERAANAAMLADTLRESEEQQRARAIMGENILSVADALKAVVAPYNEVDIQDMQRIPFTDAELEQRADTHILLPLANQSISQMERRTAGMIWPQGMGQIRQLEEFIHLRGKTEWAMIQKNETELSLDLVTKDDILPNLEPYESLPSACELSHAGLLYYIMRKNQLYGTPELPPLMLSSDETSPMIPDVRVEPYLSEFMPLPESPGGVFVHFESFRVTPVIRTHAAQQVIPMKKGLATIIKPSA